MMHENVLCSISLDQLLTLYDINRAVSLIHRTHAIKTVPTRRSIGGGCI